VLIDVSEQETERPKKQRKKYSGKVRSGFGFSKQSLATTKKHTDKALIDYSTDLNQVLSGDTAAGPVHDFKAQVQFELVSSGL